MRKFQLGRPAARLDTVQSGLEEASQNAGVRETLSLLAEAIVDLLGCSDCLISAADLGQLRVVDLAGFTHSPERWEMFADEVDLRQYPATVRVLEEGTPYTTWIGDPQGDAAEISLMQVMGLSSQLLLRLQAGGSLYLVEAWDDRLEPFEPEAIALAERLVERGARLVEVGLARDADDEARFQELVADAARVAPLDVDTTTLALTVGETLGLRREQLAEVRLVALLHQAGMSAIPATLLHKSEPLTPVEWAVVQRHTLVGRRMIEKIPSLSAAVEGVSSMRERWDGSGYPRGLRRRHHPVVSQGGGALRRVSRDACRLAEARGRLARVGDRRAAALQRPSVRSGGGRRRLPLGRSGWSAFAAPAPGRPDLR